MFLLSEMFKSIATEENLPIFLKIYIDFHPILESYEREAISDEEYQKIEKKFFELAEKRIKEFAEVQPKKMDEVIFVVEQKDTSFDSNDTYMHSFLCKVSDMKEKAYLDFSLWNDEKPRIEHYAYDFSPIDEVMGCEVYCDSDKVTEALCEIFYELTFNGLTEESSKARKEQILNDLKEVEKDIAEGRTYTAEEVFEKLDAEILEGASDEEREKILKDREERKRNKPRDERYSRMIMYHNHNICIEAIRSWYLENFKKGNITI